MTGEIHLSQQDGESVNLSIMSDSPRIPTDVERYRARLFGIAYRMLGNVQDAEDIVQEAMLRWQETDRAVVRVVSGDFKGHILEANYGILSRALDSAGGA